MGLKSFQSNKFDECFGLALGFAKLLSSCIISKKHVAQHRAPGKERFIELLEYQDQVRRRAVDRVPLHDDFSGRGSDQSGDGHEQSGLAATRRPNERNKLSGFHLARDIGNRHCRFATHLAISLGKTLDFENGHRVISRWTLGTNPKEVGVLGWWSTGKRQSSFRSRFVASNPHSSQYADPPILLTSTLHSFFQPFGARSLMTSRALMDREMSLYFCVRSEERRVGKECRSR